MLVFDLSTHAYFLRLTDRYSMSTMQNPRASNISPCFNQLERILERAIRSEGGMEPEDHRKFRLESPHIDVWSITPFCIEELARTSAQ
ncbi:hypothetical protein CC2G_003238 [Coprinopsis cinerea AmutBmut pab1-1]|nr:hypothetical protein CC2G_003238 [Coprinopsis cinerea AmutBmut pab1-1]